MNKSTKDQQKLPSFVESYAKIYADLGFAIEKAGGNSKVVLNDLYNMPFYKLIEILAPNGIELSAKNKG